jgi:hypothetical protein
MFVESDTGLIAFLLLVTPFITPFYSVVKKNKQQPSFAKASEGKASNPPPLKAMAGKASNPQPAT